MNVLTPACAKRINKMNSDIERVDAPVIASMEKSPDKSVPPSVYLDACRGYKELAKVDVSECVRVDFGCRSAADAASIIKATETARTATAALLTKARGSGATCSSVADIYGAEFSRANGNLTQQVGDYNRMNRVMPPQVWANHCQAFQQVYSAVRTNCRS